MDLKTKLIIGIALTGASVAAYFIWKANKGGTSISLLNKEEKPFEKPNDTSKVNLEGLELEKTDATLPIPTAANGFQ